MLLVSKLWVACRGTYFFVTCNSKQKRAEAPAAPTTDSVAPRLDQSGYAFHPFSTFLSSGVPNAYLYFSFAALLKGPKMQLTESMVIPKVKYGWGESGLGNARKALDFHFIFATKTFTVRDHLAQEINNMWRLTAIFLLE